MNSVPSRGALDLDYTQVEKEIVSFIRMMTEDARAKGVVIGLSGGIDSSVVGSLCVKALGKDSVAGVLMPAYHTPTADMEDARRLAKTWGIKVYEAPIDAAFDAVEASVALKERTKIAQANVKARLRMIILYYVANSLSMLVAGTGDRSEDLLGFFTEWGDGGVDFLPISHLYKTQVRFLGAHLGLPENIVTKPASPQLWPGHKATDEIPLAYEQMDPVLHCLFDKHMTPKQASKEAGVDVKVIDVILAKNKSSTHKRVYPPMVRPW